MESIEAELLSLKADLEKEWSKNEIEAAAKLRVREQFASNWNKGYSTACKSTIDRLEKIIALISATRSPVQSGAERAKQSVRQHAA